MLGIHDFPLFVISGILLNLTPGQDTMYILGRCMAQGQKAGIVSVLGIMTGILVHTLLAALGLSVILATSSLAFAMIKYAGAAYLIWLGIGFLRTRSDDAAFIHLPQTVPNLNQIFRQGVLTNVLNPKVALFFLSFLPQFVSVQAETVILPFMVLGLVFLTTGGLWCLVLVYGATWLSTHLRHRSPAGGILKKFTGTLFVGLGLRLAFFQR